MGISLGTMKNSFSFRAWAGSGLYTLMPFEKKSRIKEQTDERGHAAGLNWVLVRRVERRVLVKPRYQAISKRSFIPASPYEENTRAHSCAHRSCWKLKKEFKVVLSVEGLATGIHFVYAASRLPSFTSFCRGCQSCVSSLPTRSCGRAGRCPNSPMPSSCRAEHVCGFGGTWGRFPSAMGIGWFSAS